jgi:hypothetical protein
MQNLNAYKHGAYAESFKNEELMAKRLEQATAVVLAGFYAQQAAERRARRRDARAANSKKAGEPQPKEAQQPNGERVKKKYRKERPCRWWAMPAK